MIITVFAITITIAITINININININTSSNQFLPRRAQNFVGQPKPARQARRVWEQLIFLDRDNESGRPEVVYQNLL